MLLGPTDEIDEAAVYRIISGTEIAVETDGASEPSAGVGGSESDAAIEPLWITEKKAIEAAIAACDGSVNRAAQQLSGAISIAKFSPGRVSKISQSAASPQGVVAVRVGRFNLPRERFPRIEARNRKRLTFV